MKMRGYVLLVIICFVAVMMCARMGLSAYGEYADDEAMQKLQEEYEWSVIYIRALAQMNASLHAEKNLEAMTRLHAKLLNSRGIIYIENDFDFITRRNVIVESHINALLREIGGVGSIHWNKEIMTGTGGLLPLFKVRDGWFKTHPD